MADRRPTRDMNLAHTFSYPATSIHVAISSSGSAVISDRDQPNPPNSTCFLSTGRLMAGRPKTRKTNSQRSGLHLGAEQKGTGPPP